MKGELIVFLHQIIINLIDKEEFTIVVDHQDGKYIFLELKYLILLIIKLT
jgi:hypothetical protein